MELKDKTALITGSCGQGTGCSTALRLAREGANVVLNYGTHRTGPKTQEHAERVAAEVDKLGGHAVIQKADTRDEDQVRAMVKAAEKAFGQVDILVNNAGGEWDMGDFTAIDFDQWKSTLGAEIDATMLLMKYCLPGMRKRKWGRVVSMGMHGTSQARGAPAPAYCLGKAARAWMTEVLTEPHWQSNVTFNCIELGLTSGLSLEDTVALARGSDPQTKVSALAPETDEKRWATPWEERPKPTAFDVAGIVSFLCSDAGRFVTGSLIRMPNH